jgi:membrane-associated protease RseP (regulator of RpoE activity)
VSYTAAVPFRQAALHVGLFAACCVTTALFAGPYFAATLMTILLAHELGHYVVGRVRGVEVSLPYFIPMPPQITFGTLGAVIRMKREISDRNALFDVGAAGPVAGLVVAIPLLVLGLQRSALIQIQPDGNIEGNSILYAVLKYAVFGRWLPDARVDVDLHPVAQAAWIGLLITMINLMPIGQLDGGHIARAVLGQAHERWSRRLHVLLPVIAVATGGSMFVAGLRSGRKITEALDYAHYGFFPWLVWALMIGWMRRQAGEYHPPVADAPLDARRRLAALGMLAIFVLIATPVPFRPVL